MKYVQEEKDENIFFIALLKTKYKYNTVEIEGLLVMQCFRVAYLRQVCIPRKYK